MYGHWIKSSTLAVAVVAIGLSASALEIGEITVNTNPSGNAPLTALLTFDTDEAAVIRLAISDGSNESEVDLSDGPATSHTVPVLGLRPGREHQVTVSARTTGGATASANPVTIKTEPLPDDFPPFEISLRRTRQMEPGFSLIPTFRWGEGGPDDKYGLIFAVDDLGEVVWYYRSDHAINEARRISTGNLLYMAGRNGRMFEIDMLGNVVRQWHTTGVPKEVPDTSIPVETDTFHHDVYEIPSGNLLVLSTEVRRFEDYPTSTTNPDAKRAPANVIGDVIIEMTRDGKIVRDWKIFDILDPYQMGQGSLGTGFYAEVYKDVLDEAGKDWTHTNALIYNKSDNSVLISSYHLSSVFKISLDSGELVWILGNDNGWKAPWSDKFLKPEGDGFMMQSRQHGIKLSDRGTLLLFDNGGFRKGPLPEGAPESGNFSRAVEFEIDEETGTVRQLWQYGGPSDELFYSPFICDTDWMPKTGNVLITDGGRVRSKEGKDSTVPGAGRHWARIMEVTHTSPAEKVFELVIDDPSVGWAVYRSERLPSLYP